MKSFMRNFLFVLAVLAIITSCDNQKKDELTKSADEGTSVSATDKKPASELLDPAEGAAVRQSFEAFARGDVDAMVSNFADTIYYSWSGGDSLRGKQAVADYYKSRWKLIDSFAISETIVLPVQVNESQSRFAPTGKWTLYWGLMHVKYKNGKKLNFWIHSVNHLNEAGKVDFIGQYMDRHPIIEATKGM
jgi:hypothetical protein